MLGDGFSFCELSHLSARFLYLHFTDSPSLANNSEGAATILCGFLAYYTIVDSIQTAKFLTTEEREWLVYRKALDAGSAGEAAHVSKKFVVSALTNWQVWLSTGYYMSIVIPLYSIGLFLPTSTSESPVYVILRMFFDV